MSRNSGKAQAKATLSVSTAYTHHLRILSLRASKGSHTQKRDRSDRHIACQGCGCRVGKALLYKGRQAENTTLIKHEFDVEIPGEGCSGKREQSKENSAKGKLHNGSSLSTNLSKNLLTIDDMGPRWNGESIGPAWLHVNKELPCRMGIGWELLNEKKHLQPNNCKCLKYLEPAMGVEPAPY